MNSTLDSITAMRVGFKVLKNFKEKMKNVAFTFEDYERLQNDYEKLLYDLCIESFEKGKNDLSKKEFLIWLETKSAYIEEEKKND